MLCPLEYGIEPREANFSNNTVTKQSTKTKSLNTNNQKCTKKQV